MLRKKPKLCHGVCPGGLATAEQVGLGDGREQTSEMGLRYNAQASKGLE